MWPWIYRKRVLRIYHIPRVAVYGLAARVNLFFGNYDAALENAEEALKLNSELLDYNTFRFGPTQSNPYGGVDNRPDPEYSPEMIMYRSSAYSSILTTSMMSPELLEVFDTEADLRYKFNFTTLGWDGEPSGDTGTRRFCQIWIIILVSPR